MQIVQNILNITKEHKINNQQLCKLLNTNANKIYDWKVGKSKPSAEDVYILADYLNCSVDYLLGRTDNPTIQIDEDIDKLLKLYNSLSDTNKEKLLNIGSVLNND